MFTREFTLPDGNKVMIGSQRFKAPETLFQPSKLQKEDSGLHEQTF